MQPRQSRLGETRLQKGGQVPLPPRAGLHSGISQATHRARASVRRWPIGSVLVSAAAHRCLRWHRQDREATTMQPARAGQRLAHAERPMQMMGVIQTVVAATRRASDVVGPSPVCSRAVRFRKESGRHQNAGRATGGRGNKECAPETAVTSDYWQDSC